MKKKRYRLLTLDGKAMLDALNESAVECDETRSISRWTFSYDFSRPFLRSSIVRSEELMPECAMYHQIIRALPEPERFCRDPLLHRLIYVDFRGLFMPEYENVRARVADTAELPEAADDKNETPKGYKNLSKAELTDPEHIYNRQLQWLFDEDSVLRIAFPAEEGKPSETVEFIPFDKSASMARQGRMTFIDKSLYAAVDRRLRLDIDFGKLVLEPSKYYAYRGLYLSAAQRIVQDDQFRLNEKTVIVIADQKITLESCDAGKLIGRECSGDKPYWELEVAQKGSAGSGSKCTAFDGEGLICPEYAALVNRQLLGLSAERYEKGRDELLSRLGRQDVKAPERYSVDGVASSLQIRMPFTKGVLHSVDFGTFLRENGVPEDAKITDAFGIEREIRNAKIILTVSMLKSLKWMKTYWKEQKYPEKWKKFREAIDKIPGKDRSAQEKREALERGFFRSVEDPMKYFFGKMDEFGHALYVANTSASYCTADRIKMNYQFLNTLALSESALDALCRAHVDGVNALRTDPTRQKQYLLRTDETDEEMDGEELAEDRLRDLPPERYALSKNDAFLADDRIRSDLKGAWESAMRDTAIGRIEVRGECRFLSHDLMRLLLRIFTLCCPAAYEKVDALKKLCLRKTYFYMPKPRMFRDAAAGKYCALLRNPHLSRNEQCVLRNFAAGAGSAYARYLGHLDGVVMVATYSIAPMVLSGADFDGDLVKVTDDPIIVDAIRKGAYIKSEKTPVYIRRLPVIEIPSPEPRRAMPARGIAYYRLIRDTFSNRIGQISNMAIKFGKKEYSEESSDKKTVLEQAHACASCTLVTGLEIDAAKTGKHPNANIGKLRQLIITQKLDGSDYFIAAKDQVKKLAKDPRFKVEKDKTCDGMYHFRYYYQRNPHLTVYAPESGKLAGNIDRLPYHFAMNCQNKPKMPPRAADSKLKFCFQQKDKTYDPEWQKALELDPALMSETELLMRAYKLIGKQSQRWSKTLQRNETVKFTGCVTTILSTQYDDLSANYPGTETRIESAMFGLYERLHAMFPDPEAAKAALKRMIALQWQFTPENEREEKLAAILGTTLEDPLQISLLCNFAQCGCKLLYYILKDIMTGTMPELICEDAATDDEAENAGDAAQLRLSGSDVVLPEIREEIQENHCLRTLFPIFDTAAKKQQRRSDWQQKLDKACRKTLNGLFKTHDGGMDVPLRYVAAASRKPKLSDSRNSFLWQVIDAETLRRNIWCSEEPKNEPEDTDDVR